MIKVLEIKNEADDRACDLVRADDDSLCYQMKLHYKGGRSKTVMIPANDMIYITWEQMTESERRFTLSRLSKL
ncbi:MAG: hypothetical protein IJ065_09660 [Eubacterium sp.]|nr:hypothetical protein [Eubacterium sp.]